MDFLEISLSDDLGND